MHRTESKVSPVLRAGWAWCSCGWQSPERDGLAGMQVLRRRVVADALAHRSSPPGPRQPNGNRVVTGQGSGGKS